MLLAPVLSRLELVFPSKTWFFGIYLNFRLQKSLRNQYLSYSESKSYQVNSLNATHQDLSNNTDGTSQFLRNFEVGFNLIFSEKIIQYSGTFAPQVQTSWNQAHAPLLDESFPKTSRTRSEHPSSVDLITTKQNRPPSFTDRCAGPHIGHSR